MKTIEVVAGVIKKDEEILIAKRKGGEFDGLWEFPGGKIEENETHEEALVRELKEELNIGVSIQDFITTIKYQYKSFNLLMHIYNAIIYDGEISLNVHSDLKWVKINELEKIQWVPADVELLKFIN